MSIFDDLFTAPAGYTFEAQARFYEGMKKLPEKFKPNSVLPARELPATLVDPKLPLKNATGVVERTWTPTEQKPKDVTDAK